MEDHISSLPEGTASWRGYDLLIGGQKFGNINNYGEPDYWPLYAIIGGKLVREARSSEAEARDRLLELSGNRPSPPTQTD